MVLSDALLAFLTIAILIKRAVQTDLKGFNSGSGISCLLDHSSHSMTGAPLLPPLINAGIQYLNAVPLPLDLKAVLPSEGPQHRKTIHSSVICIYPVFGLP